MNEPISMRLARFKEKRNQLHDELSSDEHYGATETLMYGNHDPYTIPTVKCDCCDVDPVVIPLEVEATFDIVCPLCDKTIQAPQKSIWEAHLMWLERNPGSLDYRTLPLFGLRNLTVSEAKRRMVGIRRNLEIRKKYIGMCVEIAKMERTSAPGRGYQRKINAYLKWSHMILRLLKYHAEKESS